MFSPYLYYVPRIKRNIKNNGYTAGAIRRHKYAAVVVTGTLVDPAINDNLFLGRAGAANVPAIIQVVGRAVSRRKVVSGPPCRQHQLGDDVIYKRPSGEKRGFDVGLEPTATC
jgi:hypothetical protein